LRGTGTGERLAPATGRIAALPNTGPIDVELEPYAATAFRYPSAQMPARKTPTPGALPGLELRPLPHAPPHVARGEFVREQFERVALPEVAGRDVWAAQATLTKGEVDTFLFVRFAYPETVDLSQARALELESWVPEGQRTGTQLLVIVHEKDGGDFFAATARTLNSAGYEQSLVLLNRLQLAGWSQDSDGLLDLRRVEEIRVGWGGYYGREREEVTFRLTAPRAAVAR
jgi:hypothetical protein